MSSRLQGLIEFLKTTGLGGLIFLLPVLIVGLLVGQLVPLVSGVFGVVNEVLPVHTVTAYLIAIAIVLGVLIGACFLAGLIAQLSIGRSVSDWIEKNLVLFFPRYAIYREQMVGSLGKNVDRGRLRPIVVALPDRHQLGLEIERTENGLVTVYLPTAPDPWEGHVAFVEPDQIRPLPIELMEWLTILGRLGRHAGPLVAAAMSDRASVPPASTNAAAAPRSESDATRHDMT